MRDTIAAACMAWFVVGCGGGGSGGGMTQAPVPANSAPLVSAANADQSARVGTAFRYDAAQAGVFSDPDGDTLTYTVSLAGASSGLSVKGAVISGTPTDVGIVTVTVTASDPSGARVSDRFTIAIDAATAASANILFIIADDLGQDSSAQYSLVSDVPNTPTLNDLAGKGLVFENLWVNPTCSPTRAALLSGRYGTRTGLVAVGGALNPAETVIHEQLANVATTAHYKSALIGKWHLAGGTSGPNDAGIEHFAGILGGGVRDYFDWTLNVNGANTQVTTYATTEITDQAIDWVRRQTDPWFLWLAYNAPHTPFHLPPSTLHDRTLSGDRSDINANPRPYYLAAIEAMDAEIGRLLSSLDPAVRANTIVLFVGDNGTPNRVNNDTVFPKGAKGSLYEGGVRVPMIVSGAGVTRMGERENALINGVDFFASIAELAGQTLASLHDARSFLPLLTDAGARSRDYIVTEGENGQAIRDERYKLIRHSDGRLELYDLETDPTESLDIAGVSAFSTAQAKLKNALDELLAGGNWIVNENSERSSYLMDNGEFVEVNVQSVSTNAGITTVITNAVPNYRISVTDEVLAVYRSKNPDDYASGTGTLSLGERVVWGQNVGYTSLCPGTGTNGWAPAGAAACSVTQNGLRLSFPAGPTPTSTECETGLGPVGLWVNGVPIYNWSDASSYKNQNVWNNYAVPFRKDNMDMCYGHAGNGAYHHHSYNACLRQLVGDRGTGHSPIYGYAGDGYPIHGPYHAAGELTEACWMRRDYSAGSATGCGADGERSCTFIDEENISLGVRTVTAGPSTTQQLTFPGGTSRAAESGIYYEDYYYRAACSAQGENYLDEHSGHEHDGYGYHYHTAVNADLEPVFPAVHGPDYYGDVSAGSFRCFRRNF